MKKGHNFNHPKKGAQIKVEPIKLSKDIKAIKKLLTGRPRDLALFTVGNKYEPQSIRPSEDQGRARQRSKTYERSRNQREEDR